MDFLFFVLSGYLTGGLMMLFNSLIALLFGEEYCFPMATVVIIVTEFYITRMRQTNLLFREVMGLFWNDRLWQNLLSIWWSLLCWCSATA